MPRTSFVILWEALLSNDIRDIEKQERNGIAKYANSELFFAITHFNCEFSGNS